MSNSKSIQKLQKSISSKKGWLTRRLNSGQISKGSYSSFLGHLTRSLNNVTKSAGKRIILAKQAKKQASGRDTKKKRKSTTQKPTATGKTNKRSGKRKTRHRSRSVDKKRSRSATKGAQTRKLDRLNVNKIEGGKTPFKNINFITFESVEINEQILIEVIKRANMEADNPLMKVTINGRNKDSKDDESYSTIVFPIYLDEFNSEVKTTKWVSSKTGETMIDTILSEVAIMAEYYSIEAESYEFFIFW